MPDRTPVVVLVHGMVISSRYMEPTAAQLAPLCRVYAVDLPGYGKSYKPRPVLLLPQLADALAAWMDALRLRRAHFLGNSFGCQVIAEFAVRHPERIDRLVLQGPTVDPKARTLWRQLFRLWLNGTREPRSIGGIMRQDYLAAGPRRAAATVKLLLDDAIERKLPLITVPTLIVRGSRDPVVPQAWAEEAARLLPRGELRVVPGRPHTLNYSSPLELVRVVQPFLGI